MKSLIHALLAIVWFAGMVVVTFALESSMEKLIAIGACWSILFAVLGIAVSEYRDPLL